MSSIERVVIFVDGSNLYNGCNECMRRHDIDFAKFSRKLAAKRTLIRTYYYNAPLPQSHPGFKGQQSFFNSLKNAPYLSFEQGRLETRSEKDNKYMVEKGVDVAIAVDMLRLAHNNAYDTAILVSGDGDFAKAVEAVQEFGKHVENAYFTRGSSRLLRQKVDKFILLDEKYLQDCWLR